MFKIFLGIIFLSIAVQAQTKQPCSTQESRQFDFWIGDWDAEWMTKDGVRKSGSNQVINLFNGCVIEENFNGEPGNQLKGKSFSVYDAKEKIWKQTWVDNGGGYLDFKGGFNEGKMILTRSTNDKNGAPVHQRMVYYNISKNEFDWDWEISRDNGNTWELKWRIHYSRK
ncbi:MAG TPA: DUF1579 family protein [Ignavibacteriaceae bacterium]|nr:DUF1579 family protein [Ignavibacteriaceae bacterium]